MSVRDLMVSVGFDADVSKLNDINDFTDVVADDLVNIGTTGEEALGKVGDSANRTSDHVDGLGRKTRSATDDMLNSITKLGGGMESVGKGMTKWISAPIIGATTAAVGLTGALGWKRLVGMDTAKSQLEGLGYGLEDVERISGQVTSAIDGGMTTMAEGTSVAAGALAAGVQEGAELERYIKLVGDAAIGSQRPVEDMAQIFHRIEGSGKVMTDELNSIEAGMPGFAQAMADSLGVPSEEFRKMVTDGKVSSEQFLDVMDDFAGDMADAYSKSWEGMVKNTGAYIGIIGEQLLDGVFDDAKESIAGFIELLQSDAVMDWAQETGEKIGDAFTKVIDVLKSAKSWYDNLSPAVQDVMGKVAIFGTIFAAVFPPMLMIFGKILGTVAPVVGLFTKVSGALSGVGGAFALLTNPITLIIGGIILLGSAFVLAYNKVEWFREGVDEAWAWLKEATALVFDFILEKVLMVWDFIVESTMIFWQGLLDIWEEHGEFIVELVTFIFEMITAKIEIAFIIIQEVISIAWNIITNIFTIAWGLIQAVVETGINVVLGIINTVMSILSGDWEAAWDEIKGIVETIWKGIEGFFENVDLLEIGKDIIRGLIDGISSMASKVWEKVAEIADGIKEKFAWVLEIFSPSRAFKVFGENTMEGFNIGYEDEADKTMKIVDDTGNDVLDTFQFPKSFGEMATEDAGWTVVERSDVISRVYNFDKSKSENLSFVEEENHEERNFLAERRPTSPERSPENVENNYSVVINVNGSDDPRTTAREVKRVVKDYFREVEVREV